MTEQTPSRETADRQTQMFREAAEAADAVARLLSDNRGRIADVAARLRAKNLRAVITGARGSSDNAATYAKYLIETRLRIITASIGLSVGSVYDAGPDFTDTLFLAISQSGRSPDLLASVEKARNGGAYVVALVNDESSPLASLAHDVIPLCAGAERSVAATKTYLTSVAAVAALVAEWSNDSEFKAALNDLPADMRRAWEMDWSAAVETLRGARDLYTLGRGVGFGCAQEAALKFKETCGLHAEAFSAAEVQHGPMALIKAGFPLLMLSQDDETRGGMIEVAQTLSKTGAQIFVAGFEAQGVETLPTITAHPVLEPILLAQSFYRMINALSLARGFDPDSPPNLNKVTETL